MTRPTFLVIAAAIALAVGGFAVVAPEQLLHSKGAAPDAVAAVWIREVAVLLIALAGLALAVRKHADSPTLRAVLAFNAVVQLGLLPIEIAAYLDGVLGRLGGIIPNSVVHVVLGAGFAAHAARCRPGAPRHELTSCVDRE